MRFEFGEYSLDVDRHELHCAGAPVAAEPQVFDLLVYLVRNRERVVSRDDLVAAVWRGRIVSDSAVTTRINAARKAVGDSGAAQQVIRTVARKGVRFVAEVRQVDDPPPRGDRPEATSPPPPPLPLPPLTLPSVRPSIVVLPFRNVSNDPAQEYLPDAVTGDLTVDLSRMRDIAVISAATALTYKRSTLDPRQIGRDLGVRYLVVGSIGRSAELVRTNVQLIDTGSGEQRWGDRFEHQFVDLGGLENAITGRIAASLNFELVRAEGYRAAHAPQPDALDLRLRATALFYASIAPEHTLATRDLLRRSVALDASSSEAWARLGEIIASDHVNHWNDTGKAALAEADEAVRRALLIDPNLPLAHVAHGLIERARGEHYSALEAFSRAIELDRNFAFAYAHKGNELTLIGRAEEAPAFVGQALRLSPHDPSVGVFYWIIGRAWFFSGQYAEAISWLRKSVEARPNL